MKTPNLRYDMNGSENEYFDQINAKKPSNGDSSMNMSDFGEISVNP